MNPLGKWADVLGIGSRTKPLKQKAFQDLHFDGRGGQNVPYSQCLARFSVMSINLVKMARFHKFGAFSSRKIRTFTFCLVFHKSEPAVYLCTKSVIEHHC